MSPYPQRPLHATLTHHANSSLPLNHPQPGTRQLGTPPGPKACWDCASWPVLSSALLCLAFLMENLIKAVAYAFPALSAASWPILVLPCVALHSMPAPTLRNCREWTSAFPLISPSVLPLGHLYELLRCLLTHFMLLPFRPWMLILQCLSQDYSLSCRVWSF